MSVGDPVGISAPHSFVSLNSGDSISVYLYNKTDSSYSNSTVAGGLFVMS